MKVKSTEEYKLTLFKEMLQQKNSDQGDIAGLSANIRRFGSVREHKVIITLFPFFRGQKNAPTDSK